VGNKEFTCGRCKVVKFLVSFGWHWELVANEFSQKGCLCNRHSVQEGLLPNFGEFMGKLNHEIRIFLGGNGLGGKQVMELAGGESVAVQCSVNLICIHLYIDGECRWVLSWGYIGFFLNYIAFLSEDSNYTATTNFLVY
jgi:hypothetical protein